MPRREAGEPYYRVSLDEAAEMYEDENSLVIDVRRPDEYLNGHVKNATHIVVDNLYSEIDSLPKDKNLVELVTKTGKISIEVFISSIDT